MAARFNQPIMQALDDTGTAVVGSHLFFYEVGTTTFQDTYQDEALSIVNTNPVTAVTGGRFPDIWLQDEDYTVRFANVENGVDVDVWTTDVTGVSIAAATETTAGIARFATVAEMQLGTSTTIMASVQRITQDVVLGASRIQSGVFGAARLPAATTTLQGATRLADQAAIDAGTAGRVVDAEQLKVLQDEIDTLQAGAGDVTAEIDAAVAAAIADIGMRVVFIADTSTNASGTAIQSYFSTITTGRPDGGFVSDFRQSENNESFVETVRYATVQFTVDGGSTFTTAGYS